MIAKPLKMQMCRLLGLFIICCCGGWSTSYAQSEVREGVSVSPDSLATLSDSLDTTQHLLLPVASTPTWDVCAPAAFTPFDMAAPGFSGCHPLAGCYDTSWWRLHQGLNASLSMSVTAAFGRGAPRGVGFGQSAAFAYALPLTQKLSLAAGIYAHNMDWGRWHHTDVGVSAALCYKATDRVNVYGYVTRRFMPRPGGVRFSLAPTAVPSHPYFPLPFTTRIGGMAEFKIGENAMIQVGVEHRR